jgi:hypothetical protein
MELVDIAGVHRQSTGSTTEMVQPVLYRAKRPTLILTTLPVQLSVYGELLPSLANLAFIYGRP